MTEADAVEMTLRWLRHIIKTPEFGIEHRKAASVAKHAIEYILAPRYIVETGQSKPPFLPTIDMDLESE